MLGFQTLAILLTKQYGFPFVDYPMFSTSREEGERIHHYSIHATLDDGRDVRISRHDINLDYFKYTAWARAIIAYDPAGHDAETKPALLSARYGSLSRLGRWLGLIRPQNDLVRIHTDRYAQRHGVTIVKLRVEDGPGIVTREGMAPADGPLLLREIELSRQSGGN